MPIDDELRIHFHPNPKEVARWDAEAGEWLVRVQDQWVRLDYLIESLVEVRTILRTQFSDKQSL